MNPVPIPRSAALAAVAIVLAHTSLAAQTSVLFTCSGNVFNLDGGGGLVNAGRLRADEIGIVTPLPGPAYSARTLIGVGTQWAWRGDDDNDGNLVDSATAAPGNDTDAIMVKRFIAPLVPTVRDICISKEDDYSTANGFLDGDVYYHPVQGMVKTFITEAQIETASGATTIDVDAMCQDVNGDIYLSFATDETTSDGLAENSSIVRIPVTAISYDMSGDVAFVTADSVEVLNLESDLNAFIANSGMLSNGGGTPFNATNDLSGLEIDPAGGTWVSPLNGNSYPNLLLTWDSGNSNDCGIVSTAGGGSIALVNGVPMGNTIGTTGLHLGLLPQSTGQSDAFGLALIDGLDMPVTLENYPENLLTSLDFGFSRQEVSGATPFAPVAFLVSIGPLGPGTALSSTPFPGLFAGEIFEPATAFVTTTQMSDVGGFAEQTLDVSGLVGSGLNICWQAYDFGLNRFSLPAPIQF